MGAGVFTGIVYSINPPQRAVSDADHSVPGGDQGQLGQLGQERGGRLDAPDQHHELLRQARLDGAAERPGRPGEAGEAEQAATLLLLSDQQEQRGGGRLRKNLLQHRHVA